MSLGRCLVLNAAGQPVEVTSAEEAIWDVMKGQAFVVEGTGHLCHSPSTVVEIPSVIQQVRWHKPKKTTKARSLPLTPRNVCGRDRWICAYQVEDICQGRATTIDHIHPRSEGGENIWENVVASCHACNHKKGRKILRNCPCNRCHGKTLEGGLEWTLHNKPWRPTGALARVLVHANRKEWFKYLG